MLFFGKSEFRTQEMYFRLCEPEGDMNEGEKCIVDIEAYDLIDGEMRYFFSSFCLKNPSMYDNGDFEQMIELLRDTEHRKVSVKLKYKKGILKGFRLSVESLAKAYNDERFLQLELTGWGINDRSAETILNGK